MRDFLPLRKAVDGAHHNHPDGIERFYRTEGGVEGAQVQVAAVGVPVAKARFGLGNPLDGSLERHDQEAL